MGWWEGFVDMGCCCDSSVLSGGWSGGVGEGRRVSSGRVKSGGPSAVQTKIGAMVTKDTTVRLSACDEDTFLFIHLTYLYNRIPTFPKGR